MKTMKHRMLLLALTAVLCMALSGCKEESEQKASVQSVSMVMGTETGPINRYGGIVVSQSETEIPKDDTKTIEEILVKAGDAVTEGQVLFTYDKENLNLTIQKAELEIEQIKNQITSYGDQIAELEKERKKASSADKLSYTVQIQGLELDRKEAEYNVKVKETELENMRHTLESNEVTSPINGRVQTINENGGTDQYGNALPFMTIVESGSYRVKGTLNESNRMELMEGTPVIVRSRTDREQFWTGVVEMINWESPETSQNQGMYYGGNENEMTTSSKYPFFISLNDNEGLILGQHVYIEADYGQSETDGVWLNDGYLVKEGDTAYVWAASANSTLEKRVVSLGEHDDAQGKTQITEGLTPSDYIAWPENSLKAGMSLVYYDEEAFEQATTGNMDEMNGEDMTGMDGEGMNGFDGEGMNGFNGEGMDGFDGEGMDGSDGEGMDDPNGESGETMAPMGALPTADAEV